MNGRRKEGGRKEEGVGSAPAPQLRGREHVLCVSLTMGPGLQGTQVCRVLGEEKLFLAQ